jgi:ribonucleoside-diphosphate reductase alpha chain
MDDDKQVSFREFLMERGFTNEDLVTIEGTLPTVFDISFAFSSWSIPEHILNKYELTRDQATSNELFNGLRLLGITGDEIRDLNRHICGSGTVEGAPSLEEDHLAVFDCASRCGETGTRFISPEGHIRMMAACQPFITGAISKTINLPNEASTDDISKSYWLSWELGLKSNALYRDGCKLSQPLNTKSDATLDSDEDDLDIAAARNEVADEVIIAAGMVDEQQPRVIEKIVEKIIEKPMRKRLPDTRRSITHH